MKERFEELTIETANDDNGQFIILTQDNCGNAESVAIHLMHLRYMAEKFGLIATSDPQASKAITTLQRRLTVLHERIDFLQSYLANHSDHKHADLTYEVTYATATLDIANEFCAEFESATVANEPVAPAEQSGAQASLI